MKWTIVEVKDFCEIGGASIKTGPFGTQLKASEYSESGTPVINVRNLGYAELRKDEKLEYLPPEKAAQLSGHILIKNDIVFGRKGAVDRHLLVNEASDGWIQGSDCIRLRFSSDKVFPRYVSHFFCTKEHKRWMENHCSFGSTMASLNESIVRKIKFPLPPLPTQQKIASILSAYDDLIENNLKRIRLLEEAAQHLYREWFVKFRFPGWEGVEVVDGLPKGWERKKLSDIYITSSGGTPSRTNPEFYIGEVNWFKSKELMDCPLIESEEKISEIAVQRSSAKLFPANTVLLAMYGATIGKLGILTIPATSNQACCGIISKDKDFNHFYLYQWLLSNKEHILSFRMGAAQENISQSVIRDLEMITPEREVVQQFNQFSELTFQQIVNLTKQNQKLKEARDILLPRLMNQTIVV